MVGDWSRRPEEVWNSAHTHLQCVVYQQKVQANRQRSVAPVFHPSDRVSLSMKDLPPRRKLSPRFVGPFKVPSTDYSSPSSTVGPPQGSLLRPVAVTPAFTLAPNPVQLRHSALPAF